MAIARLSPLLYLLVVAVLDAAVPADDSSSSEPPCKEGFFHCPSGGHHLQCIPDIWVCNDEDDCVDGEDEMHCLHYHTNRTCKSDQYKCKSGNKRCIYKNYLCDGDEDCAGGEDESNCDKNPLKCADGQFKCSSHDKCLSLTFLCDDQDDCGDGSDEEHCECSRHHAFHCSDGQRCPPWTAACDGDLHCKDGSDEGGRCADTTCALDCGEGVCFKTPSGPQCNCKNGYKDIDGHCEDVNECEEDYHCDHYCSNSDGRYTCSCKSGYQLHSRGICKAIGTSSAVLLYSTKHEIRAYELASGVEFGVFAGQSDVIAVAYDPVTDKVFWSDQSSKLLSKSLRGNDHAQVLIRKDVGVIHGIAVDWLGRNIYLADKDKSKMVVCNADNMACTILMQGTSPTAIQLDILDRHIYWTDTKQEEILKANMDGSERRVLLQENITWPNALALDAPAKRLYWLDAKMKSLDTFNVDQESRRLIPGAIVNHPYSMAVWDDKIYWSDLRDRSILSAHKTDGKNKTVLFKHVRSYGIVVYHEQMMTDSRPSNNPCSSAGCSDICLLTSRSPHFTCACPKELILSSDKRKCIEVEDSPMLVVSTSTAVFSVKMREFADPETERLISAEKNFKDIADIDYDPLEKSLMVCDRGTGEIVKVDLSTPVHKTTVLVSDITKPSGIAADWSRKNLYWVDSHQSVLEVSTLDGLYRTELPLGTHCSGLDVVVSHTRGRVIIACDSPSARILSCTRAGGPCQVLAKDSVKMPLSLSIDQRYKIDQLYWTDVGYDRLNRLSLLDGSNRSAHDIDDPAAVLVWQGQMYYTTVGDYSSVHVVHDLDHPANNTRMTLDFGESGVDSNWWNNRGHMSLSSVGWTSEIPGGPTSYQRFCEDPHQPHCQQLCLEDGKAKRVCACSLLEMLDTDEVSCVPKKCNPGFFMCSVNGECVPEGLRCNNVFNCPDGSDESPRLCCTGDSFNCSGSASCVDASRVCDGWNDCDDGSDETACKQPKCNLPGYAPCLSGDCYLSVMECDGINNCDDGSDEKNCPPCETGYFKCRDGKGRCLPDGWKCDGSRQCVDGSDEEDCTTSVGTSTEECQTGFVRCFDGSNCVPPFLVCDGKLDCPGGADEALERCPKRISCDPADTNCSVTCSDEQFSCRSGRQCIASGHLCDGVSQCNDESDENDCSTIVRPMEESTPVTRLEASCGRGHFHCGGGDCIPDSRTCDGEIDCANDADEGPSCGQTCKTGGGCAHRCHSGPKEVRCYCRRGYRLLNDGRSCEDVDECVHGDACSHYCNNTLGSFSCSCSPGYALAPDTITCLPTSGKRTSIALLSGSSLKWMGASSEPAVDLNFTGKASSLLMDYDSVDKNVFFLDTELGSVSVYKLDSKNFMRLVSGLQKPSAFILDPLGRNIYVAQTLNTGSQLVATVKVCSLRTMVCSTVYEDYRVVIPSLAMAKHSRKLYLCVQTIGDADLPSRIVQMSLDGSQNMTVLTVETGGCSHLALDEPKKRIYWANHAQKLINSASLVDESKQTVVYKQLEMPAESLYVDGSWVLWLLPNRTLQRCNKHSSSLCFPVHLNFSPRAVTISTGVVDEESTACSDSSCNNLCVTVDGAPVCLCDQRTAPRCSIPTVVHDTLGCHPDPCTPGGVCLPTTGGRYTCRCDSGHEGNNCLVEKVGKSPSFVTPLVVVLVLLLLVGSAAGLYYYFRRPLLLFKRKTSSKNQVRFSNPAFGASKEEIDATLRHVTSTTPPPPPPPPHPVVAVTEATAGPMVSVKMDDNFSDDMRSTDADNCYSAGSQALNPLVCGS